MLMPLGLLLNHSLFAQEGAQKAAGDSKIAWRVIPQLEANTEYLVQLNYLKLKDVKDIPKLTQYTQKVIAQLHKSEGAMQFSLHARPENGEFWTLSVWKDEKSMKAFARSKAHSDAVSEMMDSLEDTGFEQFLKKGSEMVTDWAAIIK